MRSEKDTLMEVLAMKTADVKSTLKAGVNRAEHELERHLKHQSSESNRMDYQIEDLKQEKTHLSA